MTKIKDTEMTAKTTIEIAEITDVFSNDNISTDYVYATSKKAAKAALMSILKAGKMVFGIVKSPYFEHNSKGLYIDISFENRNDGIETDWHEVNNEGEKIYVAKVVLTV